MDLEFPSDKVQKKEHYTRDMTLVEYKYTTETPPKSYKHTTKTPKSKS